MQDAFAKGGKNVEYHDYYKYRISYITEKDLELMFLFVTGLTDNFENIKKELIKCKKEFLNFFEDILQHKFDAKTFEIFDPTIDSIHRNLRPKISLVGFSGVGKTTITRLIKAEEIPMEHIPTITGDIATIKIGKLHFHLWDFAGQEQFSYLWNNFIKGSDAVLLITDSTLENIEKSKFFLELIKEQAPQAHTSVIGNKQDLDDALKPEQIEKILGLKTYSMIAKDSGNRDKMITIIADILEMSAEVSPLLQPLLERDIYTEKAVKALEDAKFEEAAMYFEKISDLCIELGDDSLGKEFYEKSQKINTMLQAASAPQTEAVQEPPKPKEEPPKSIEPPPKPIETPPKSIETPPKPIETPPKPIETPPKPIETPPKPIETPPKPIEAPLKPIEAPPKPIETPPKSIETPPKSIETPPKPIETPPKPIEAPPKPIEAPPKPIEAPPKPIEAPPKPIDVPPVLKKPTLPASPKVNGLVKPEIPAAIPPHSTIKAGVAGKEPESVKTVIPTEQREVIIQKQNESEMLVQPKIKKTIAGLNLNPEDFMVKQRPKTVTVVPKDAKNKLKTSPFGHVSNPTVSKKPVPISPIELVSKKKIPSGFVPPVKNATPKIQNMPKVPSPKMSEIKKEPPVPPKPVSPTTLVKPAPKITPRKEPDIKTQPNVVQHKTTTDIPAKAAVSDAKQKADLENSLMDLKIKKANISKMSLDFDMKELTGEITEKELGEKKIKLTTIENNINEQIKEIEKLLGR
ncbi:MAG: GTP-binding protein [Candidatus Lokiarchaeota archaeon]|nr:GTP-binding protein [Candidatus Lokiarchaeota archaeon]